MKGQPLNKGNVTFSQQAGPVTPDSVRRLEPSQIELAIVLGTAATVSNRSYARAQRLATSVLNSLASGVRVAVVSAGGDLEVLSGVNAGRGEALAAVRNATRSGRLSGIDGVALASDLLKDSGGQSRNILLISTGDDKASRRNAADVLSTLDERRLNLQAIGVGGPVDSSWGKQCPAAVGSGDIDTVGLLLASRLGAQYEVVLARADFSAPLTVRVLSGAVDVRTSVAPVEPETAVPGTPGTGPQPTGSGRGIRVWLIAGLGILASVAILGVLLMSPQSLRSAWLALQKRLPRRRRPRRRRRARDSQGPAGAGQPQRPRQHSKRQPTQLPPDSNLKKAPVESDPTVLPEAEASQEGVVPRGPAGKEPMVAERAAAWGPEALPATEPRFIISAYRSLSARELTKLARRPDDHQGERIIVYGQIIERGSDHFFALTGATPWWPSDTGQARHGDADSEPRGRGKPLAVLLGEHRAGPNWRMLSRYGVGPGLAWQRGLWSDELRPAPEQLAGLTEGDIFKAFVTVVGRRDDSGGAMPSFLIDRITVYARSLHPRDRRARPSLEMAKPDLMIEPDAVIDLETWWAPRSAVDGPVLGSGREGTPVGLPPSPPRDGDAALP